VLHESSASPAAVAHGAATAPRRGRHAVAGVLVLLVVAAFSPCLRNDFVTWDDAENFLDNPSYRGLGWPQVRWAWTTFHLGVYQPLAWMLLEGESALWGLDPRGYHLTSLVLYAVDTVVLFMLTGSLLARCGPGPVGEDPRAGVLADGLAVALFAVHPLRTEVVAWASCQPYLPCALFFMLAILAYLRAFRDGPAPRRGALAGAFALFLAALLSKPVAVSLPAVLLILDVYPLRRLGGGPGRWAGPSVRGVWREKVPFAAASLVFMGLAVASRPTSAGPADLLTRVAQACYGACFYLVKMAWPFGITAFYPIPDRPVWRDPPFLASVVAVLGLSLGAWRLRRRFPGLLAAWSAYLVILAPNSGLVRYGDQIAADRYSFLALMGGVVLAAAGFRRAWRAGPLASPAAAGLAAAGVGAIVGLSLLSREQCRTWRTTEALWSHVLRHGGGDSEMAHTNLGTVLLDQGRVREAAAQFAAALRLNPGNYQTHNNMGVVFSKRGRLEEAKAQFLEALRLNPRFAKAHDNLGVILFGQGRVEEARAHYAEALRLDPGYADAHTNLGVLLGRQGRFREAEAEFSEALKLDPDNAKVHFSLGVVLLDQGRLDEARARLSRAAELDPNDATTRTLLGIIRSRQGRVAEAPPRGDQGHQDDQPSQRADEPERAEPDVVRQPQGGG
jgi:protein O-mannosyl-transferase